MGLVCAGLGLVAASDASDASGQALTSPWGRLTQLNMSQPHSLPDHPHPLPDHPHPLPDQPHPLPDRPLRSSGVHALSTGSTVASENWAGLADTGGHYTSVSAGWTVPHVAPSVASEASATWIGIDGFGNGSLIQTGTAQDTANGVTSYYAWYELLPSAAVEIATVSPGDQMTATITQVTAGTWTIVLGDLTAGHSASETVSYGGPATSAEWVEEAPSSGNPARTMTLADFGATTFTAMSVGPTAIQPADLTSIDMADSSGAIIAYPGTFDVASNSFPITYGAPSTGTSPPPTSSAPVATLSPVPVAALSPTTSLAACNETLPSTSVVGMASSGDGDGYWVADRSGRVASCGDAPDVGQVSQSLTSPVIAIAATGDGRGFWLATAAGHVLSFGDAHSSGQITTPLNKPIVAMAADPATGGYWLLGADGGVFSFEAPFFGSTGNIRLDKPAVGMVATADGSGYYFVASDGGVFAYDAAFYGSTGGTALNRPVVGMALDPTTGGYWLVAADGGIFSFNAPFEGSTGSERLNEPCVSMTAYPAGPGYRFVAADGGIFDFKAPYEGSAA